jgi:hypothetical protein
MRYLVVMMLSVELGGAFGMASAQGRELSSTSIEVNLSVEVRGGGSVVAHLLEPGADQRTIALADRGGGVYGGFFDTRKVDLIVVFEVLGSDVSVQSPPVRLTDLGLDPALLGILPGGPTTTITPASAGSASEQWGWAGLGLGALALAFLAWWALPDRERKMADAAASEEAMVDQDG